MKKKNIIISNYIIIIYILLIIFNYNLNKSINKEKAEIKYINKDNIYLFELFKNIGYDNNDMKKIFPFEPKPFDNETDKDFNEIQQLEKEINELNTENTKKKIYIIFLSILAVIFFLMIIIYSSIKIYIVCANNSLRDYRFSDLNSNKFGGIYLDENRQERISNTSINNSTNYGAPIYANNNYQQDTFNPDNCLSSSQDKKLYKPYKNEDIQ